MRFALTEEQVDLQGIARSFLGELPSGEALLDLEAVDPESWARIAEDQAWQAIVLPEAVGGFGMGHVELMVVMEECGRALVPTPLLATVGLAASVIEAGAHETLRDEVLGAIAGGSTATVSLEGGIVAQQQGDQWILQGATERVLDGHTADWVVLRTQNDGLFLVEGAALERTATPGLDRLRPMARVAVDLTVDADRRIEPMALVPALERARVLLAAECLGGAVATLDLSVDYAKVRKQFGKPIGAFQAIQHTCADMLVAVESARSAVMYAAWALDADAPDRALASHTAKATAADAFVQCAGDCIQVHGGIGFTWEHDAHIHFKRARVAQQLLGHSRVHREAVARAVLGG